MLFNDNRANCPTITPIKRRISPTGLDQCGFQMNDKPIEYVQSVLHLGHLITSSLVDNDDIVRRYGQFVYRSSERYFVLLQT